MTPKIFLAGLLGAALGAALTLATAAHADADPETVVKAHRFELIGADGKPRALFRVTAGGAPELMMANDNGAPLAMLGRPAGGGGLILFDKEGRPRAALTVGAKGPQLELLGEDGKPVAAPTPR